MKRKLVYIAGPYRAPTPDGVYENIQDARSAAKAVWRMGAYALCPHTNAIMMDGVMPDYVFLEGTMEMMRRCDVVLLMPNWKESKGAIAEREEAERLGIPVFSFMGLADYLSKIEEENA